jgi:ribonuclease BN (tRNA processing enzyme)
VGRLAKQAGAKRLVLTHFNPLDNDAQLAELLAQVHKGFPGAELGYDGMVIDLGKQ